MAVGLNDKSLVVGDCRGQAKEEKERILYVIHSDLEFRDEELENNRETKG